MNNLSLSRILLSHNFDIPSDIIPTLSREEFAEVFRIGFGDRPSCQIRLVNHPHWIVEIVFDRGQFSPKQIGKFCSEALANKRISQGIKPQSLPDILVLGGVKTTPPTSASSDALQTGDWGVDVVETISSNTFLQGISWEVTVASKPVEEIFKVEYRK